MATSKVPKLKIGFIGGGHRGPGLYELLLEMPDVEITAVCDLYEDRAKGLVELSKKAKKKAPKCYTDYLQLLDENVEENLDAIIAPTAWESHVQIAVAAMEHGLPVAIEVGGAYSLDDCWQLVRVSEATGMPCMLLENCCYGREELLILKMVREKLFGEVVHCQGGYHHDLREEICMGEENRHYRLRNFKTRNGELYPTHELGPICKWLNINRGNRMLSLTATASKAVGLNAWAKAHRGENDPLATFKFNEGDIVTTVIKCANGETIVLTHDCSLHRPYSRGLVIQGTKGIYIDDRRAMSVEGISEQREAGHWDPDTWTPIDDLWEKHEHPLWKKFQDAGVKGGHGGMDFLVLRAFVEAIRDGKLPPIDVYDTAAWKYITQLSEASIAQGYAPVSIPDFTNGQWVLDRPYDKGTYCLEEVCEPNEL
ncbi:MAG: Gfo/Idh/MocA family oxidoreductase [Lentisphaeria bacterium]|nr:Gfo/Idh/MocA family oxidoreductase [Lentisphaeria bacterium]